MTDHGAPARGPFHDWYETWRAQQTDRREAEAVAYRRHRRDDNHIALLLIAYTILLGVLGIIAVAVVMVN